MDRNVFFENLADTAIEGWKKYQILPSIFLSQTAHETGFGTSELAQKANNFWGIKKKGEGYAYHKKTWEVVNGKDEYPIEPFEWFASPEEGVEGYYQVFHGSDWRKNNYSKVIGETDYRKAAKALVEAPAPYATDPNYAEKIVNLIETYELRKYDEMAGIYKDQEATVDTEVPAEEDEKPSETLSEQPEREEKEEEPIVVSKKSYIIDPGHGGSDPGANGFGVREKDWNLRISLYQYDRLKELGVNVAITRTDDRTLSSTARTNMIRNKYDVCISNHWNAFNGSARGVETIHSVFGGKQLATDLANALVRATGIPLRRVFSKRNNSGTDWYFMHRLTGNTRTVIIEYGFIDNRADHNWYKNNDNFYKAAEAVIEVICKDAGVAYRAPGASKVSKPSVPSPSLPSGSLYKVQAGAFGKMENAEALQERLENAAIDSFIIQRDGLYKVQAGAYSKRENAEEQLQRVKQAVGDAFIVQESGEPAAQSKPAPKQTTPSYVGKRVESIHNGKLRFYNKASWSDADVAGTITRGYGFPTIVKKLKVGSGEQYQVKNSRGVTYYITASPKFVKVV